MQPPDPGPFAGVPLGGIGCGSIGRGLNVFSCIAFLYSTELYTHTHQLYVVIYAFNVRHYQLYLSIYIHIIGFRGDFRRWSLYPGVIFVCCFDPAVYMSCLYPNTSEINRKIQP